MKGFQLFGALLLAMLPVVASAQTVSGTLVRTDGSAAFGIQIVAVESSSQRVVSRTITGSSGRFRLSVSPSPVILRAVRIGHLPVELARLQLQDSEQRAVRLVLTDNPIPLRQFVTSVSRRCEQSNRAAPELVELFSDVRTALTAVRLSSVDSAPYGQVALIQELQDRRGVPLAEPFVQLLTGPSKRPFQAISAQRLRAEGYLVQERDSVVYHVPDTDVLASDEFLEDHCFSLVPGPDAHPEWIGIRFAPSKPVRGKAGIRGTFWVERESRLLQQLDFLYDGLPRAFDTYALGGSVEFSVLPDGTWFEKKWHTRMARTTARLRPGSRFAVSEVYVDGLQRVGGEVLTLSRGEQVLYVGNERLAEMLATQASADADPQAVHYLNDAEMFASVCSEYVNSTPRTSLISGTVFDGRRERVVGATVHAVWSTWRRVVNDVEQWTDHTLDVRSGTNGFYRLCGAHRDVKMSLWAAVDLRESATVQLRIPVNVDRVRVDLTVPDGPEGRN